MENLRGEDLGVIHVETLNEEAITKKTSIFCKGRCPMREYGADFTSVRPLPRREKGIRGNNILSNPSDMVEG